MARALGCRSFERAPSCGNPAARWAENGLLQAEPEELLLPQGARLGSRDRCACFLQRFLPAAVLERPGATRVCARLCGFPRLPYGNPSPSWLSFYGEVRTLPLRS